MDGASIAAIEPKLERRPMTAPPLMAPQQYTPPEPAAAPAPTPAPAYASAPAPVAAAAPLFAEPAVEEEQPDIFAAPVAEAPITRIVDPAAAEPQDEPLFAEPAYEERRPRGGFLSIFGSRPRYDAPQPAPPSTQHGAAQPRSMPSRGGALPAEAAAPEEAVQQGEDLEIPSFLRRLAN
jgi:cell division protein FtsZ